MDGLIALALAKKAAANGTTTLSGTGAPVGSIVAKKGDLYLDTTNNQAYMCTRYTDPNNLTDLTGLTAYFNNTINPRPLLPSSGYKDYNLTFDTVSESSESFTKLRAAKQGGNAYSFYYVRPNNTTVTIWIESTSNWNSNTQYRTIAITGGTDTTNSTLIEWFKSNATLSGVGSTWIALDSELPVVSSVDNGKVLGVDNGGWAKIDAPSGLPTITTGDAGKVLTVNSGETGTEWSNISGVTFIKSSTDPTDYVGSKGDIYYNSTSDNLFVKTDDTITGLEGHKFGYKSQVDASMITETTEFSIVFKYNSEGSNPETCTGLKLYANGDVAVFTNAYWQQTNNGVWTQNPVGMEFVSGTDLTDPLLVEWVVANAVTMDGQPISNDYWLNFKDAVGGVQYHSGSGAPTSIIIAKVGDLYRDTVTNRIYQCSNYVDPSMITNLTNLTITFNDTIPTDQFNTTGTYSINFGNESGSSTGIAIQKGSTGGSLRTQSGTGAIGFNFCNIYQTWTGWDYPVVKTVTITGGNDVTNANLIGFISRNASISGVGSSWVELVAKSEMTYDVLYDGQTASSHSFTPTYPISNYKELTFVYTSAGSGYSYPICTSIPVSSLIANDSNYSNAFLTLYDSNTVRYCAFKYNTDGTIDAGGTGTHYALKVYGKA